MAQSGPSDNRRRPRPAELNLPDMQQRRIPTPCASAGFVMPPTSVSSGHSMPPGAVGSSTRDRQPVYNYNHLTEQALLRSAARENQPHLHPKKANGALWFGVDPSVHKFIRTTWQAYYWGPWSSWKFVTEERKTSWWHTFIKIHTQHTVCQKISRKKRDNEKPKYISQDDWSILLANWATQKAKDKSVKAAKSRTAAPPGKEMSKHSAGPNNFAKLEYDMMVEGGLDEPPSFIDLVRKTHTRKDGSFIDERAEALVLEVEEAVDSMLLDEDSPNSGSPTASTATTAPSRRFLLDQEFLKRAKTSKGRVYGIGSVQFRGYEPSQSVPASLKRSLDMDLRVSGIETNAEHVQSTVELLKTDMTTLKGDFLAFRTEIQQEMAATRSSLNVILQALGALGAASPQVNQPACDAPPANQPACDAPPVNQPDNASAP
ncbi:hypothetical protein HA466_0122810 [Hirschfeldia incana]|nr:hypothetical protein HA466_0122810 [Hirschfeldia incana]